MFDPGQFSRVLAALAFGGAIGLAAPARADATSDILLLKGADRQKVLEEGARKEGELMFYSALTIDQGLRAIVDGFMKKYPFVKAEFWRGTELQIVQKTLAEQRANAMVGDVIESVGIVTHMTRANALLPFYSPHFEEIPERYRDKSGLSAATRLNFFGLAYNTRLVPPGSQPKTYDELLDPKWKGKIAWREDAVSGSALFITAMMITRGEKATEDYLQKLRAQNIVSFTGSGRTLVNRVIEGEYQLAVNIFMHHATISNSQGAPTLPQPMEPIPSISGSMMIPKGVKHPYAAALFTDFFLSPDGQAVMRDAQYFPVTTTVKPLKELEPIMPASAGLEEIFVSDQQLFDWQRKTEAIYKKYFR